MLPDNIDLFDRWCDHIDAEYERMLRRCTCGDCLNCHDIASDLALPNPDRMAYCRYMQEGITMDRPVDECRGFEPDGDAWRIA